LFVEMLDVIEEEGFVNIASKRNITYFLLSYSYIGLMPLIVIYLFLVIFEIYNLKSVK